MRQQPHHVSWDKIIRQFFIVYVKICVDIYNPGAGYAYLWEFKLYSLLKIVSFIFWVYNAITSFPFLLSRLFHTLPAFCQRHGLFWLTIVTYIYVYTNILLHTWILRLLLVYMFSRLTIWYWCALLLERLFLLFSEVQGSPLIEETSLCNRLRPYTKLQPITMWFFFLEPSPSGCI